MKRSFFTLIVMLITSATVFGQAQVGIRLGANWATVIRENDVPAGVETPWQPGITIGVASSFAFLSPAFAIAPEINFSQRGSSWEEGGISSKDRYNFLEVPVLFRLSFGEVLRGYVNAGPMFSYWLGGKTDNEDINFSEIDNENRWELGASLGGGVQLNTGLGSFLIDLRYTRGFTDAFKEATPGGDNFKHQLISTSLIFLIPSVQ